MSNRSPMRRMRIALGVLLAVATLLGPIIGWGIVIVPLAFLLSWMLLSVRLLRFAGRLFAGAARGCRQQAVRLAVPERR